ncbi:MAG: hypothetical protein JWP66_1768 [Naasia sp.]|nr:hypothetical protein [Naasia sp.]
MPRGIGAFAGCAPTDQPASAGTDGGPYADGTCQAEGEYRSPGGEEPIGVSVTLEDDIVTAVEVTPRATDGNAEQYQGQFASGIAAEGVSKDIDELQVSRVAGSSLTSQGFTAALEAIKADAAG